LLDNIGNILKNHQLSNTTVRRLLLEMFYAKEEAIKLSDIEKTVGQNIDRITLYRTLQAFVQKGIVHSIPTEGKSPIYALCQHNHCSNEKHEDNHIHFNCQKCTKVYCLNNTTIPTAELPKGYIATQSRFLVSGICAQCAN
jgi:Fur family transcriptional regulator, ferric uptake regulator